MNRCILLEEFKNKFETLMSPDIISSFNSKSIGKTQKFQIYKTKNFFLKTLKNFNENF